MDNLDQAIILQKLSNIAFCAFNSMDNGNNCNSNQTNLGCNKLNNTPQTDIGSALKSCLLQGHQEGRLTYGVYDAAKMLEMNPDNVMMCVLPEDTSDDVTQHIHFTLLEAFCWENEIRLIKVKSTAKIAQLLGEKTNDNDIPSRRRTEDFSCVLVEYPQNFSIEDEDVLEHYKSTEDACPRPIISLPDP